VIIDLLLFDDMDIEIVQIFDVLLEGTTFNQIFTVPSLSRSPCCPLLPPESPGGTLEQIMSFLSSYSFLGFARYYDEAT
jgi:hypothetical protein